MPDNDSVDCDARHAMHLGNERAVAGVPDPCGVLIMKVKLNTCDVSDEVR